MNIAELNTIANTISHKAAALAPQQQQFLADLIAIRS